VQLTDPEFVSLVVKTLEATGLKPELLDLELTETTLVEHGGRSTESMEHLRSLGVRLSIDDFGTGYSSLGYLRDLPVHRLKIDRVFVRDIAEKHAARALLESMIEMGRTLNLQVLAEGVETPEQLEILRGAGCDEIQGFLISRAVPASEAQRLLVQRNLLPELDLKIPTDPGKSLIVAA
jgi:EAL domain-containing protein (putative c-di-GMP-specific phosphodiesterase class I)